MNCKFCQKNLDAFREGLLPSDMQSMLKGHIDTCKECNHVYNTLLLADRVIEAEKETESDPFLATRVMAHIEGVRYTGESGFTKVLRPALYTLSLAAAVFAGILIGRIPVAPDANGRIPVELALMNDLELESIDFLSLD